MHSPSLVTDSLWPHGLWPTRLLCPRVSPGKNTGVGCHVLLQAIFPAQGLNPGLPYCRQNLYHLSCQGSPSDEILGKEKWNTVNKATTFLKKAKGACKKKKAIRWQKENQIICDDHKYTGEIITYHKKRALVWKLVWERVPTLSGIVPTVWFLWGLSHTE